jgi:RNA polymerase sigma-70 factor (ECF subfamily)
MASMPSVAITGLVDRDSAEWLRSLRAGGAEHEAAAARLHALLTRVAFAEVRRRRPQPVIDGPELDDVAHQAAADALVSITGKLDQFRGESRFTTWACKFVMFEVSNKLGRHFWRQPNATLDAEDWDQLPARFGFDPGEHAEYRGAILLRRRLSGSPPAEVAPGVSDAHDAPTTATQRAGCACRGTASAAVRAGGRAGG